jgi:hypothetical protein
MPRGSELKSCVKCGGKAQIDAFTGYYVLRVKSGTGPREDQVKGTLRARGFCIECFMLVAKGHGLDRGTRVKLRRKLESP